MTIKLYDEFPYLSSFDATVIECTKKGDKYVVLLDKTAFFPEQGGQYADNGYIGEAYVSDAHIKDGNIYHYVDKELIVGKEYHCTIEFEERYIKMQNHSGEHIVSGLMSSVFGFRNVGFHLSDDGVTIDYDGYIERDDLDKIEKMANEAIYKNVSIICEFPSEETLKTIDYRSKLELTENVRIVTIPGYDVCACCAPHVKSTGEIGIIKLLEAIHYKGGIRIKMLAGKYALEDYNVKYKSLYNISNLVSSKTNEAYEAVESLLAENKKLKYELGEARRLIAINSSNSFDSTEDNICAFFSKLDIPSLREFVNLTVGKTAKLCCAFSEKDGGGFNYVIGSNMIDLSKEGKNINQALDGHGGGKPNMIQGSVNVDKDTIMAYFK